jgi:hypothetical protein
MRQVAQNLDGSKRVGVGVGVGVGGGSEPEGGEGGTRARVGTSKEYASLGGCKEGAMPYKEVTCLGKNPASETRMRNNVSHRKAKSAIPTPT